jgi:hypothetical protein
LHNTSTSEASKTKIVDMVLLFGFMKFVMSSVATLVRYTILSALGKQTMAVENACS